MLKKIFSIFTITLLIISSQAYSQSSTQIGQELNAITTGVPFLLIAPDARAGAMGDAGAATSPDPNSAHWNPAKYAFMKEDVAVNLSYIPWLRNLVGDINFSNISGAYKIDKNQAFGLTLMYFSLGNITFTDVAGERIKDYRPNEFSLDLSYALKLHDNFSGGIAIRYIHSNLTGGFSQSGSEPTHPGNAFAADISMYYTKPLNETSNLSAGVNISNLGTKISYSDDANQEFLPANMRIGLAYSADIDEFNSITITGDINKLLVPTPPLRDANDSIIKGKDPYVSVPKGVFQSFSDAPRGFEEEIEELMYSVGAEYWYNKQFALRLGYFSEHKNKGNRKYFTFGLGVKLNVFNIDFAYLVPPAGKQNPLANTLRFTLGFNIKALRAKKS